MYALQLERGFGGSEGMNLMVREGSWRCTACARFCKVYRGRMDYREVIKSRCCRALAVHVGNLRRKEVELEAERR